MKTQPTVSTLRRLAVIYAVLVIGVSSVPGVKIPAFGEGRLDVVLHFVQYGILGLLVSLGWGPGRRTGRVAIWISVLVLVTFATADEIHQRWIPGRFAEWGDWLADLLGMALGYIAGYRVNLRWNRKDLVA